MKKLSLAILISLGCTAGAVWAQDAGGSGIRESTDPSRAAAVEQRAREIQAAQQQGSSQQGTQASSSDKTGAKPHKRGAGGKHKSKSRHDAKKTSGGAPAANSKTDGSSGASGATK
jgi:hypothetical protein